MATKNGVCPYCQFNRLQNRIFPVNPEASTVFCPSCMRELDPKKAIGLYNDIISKMVAKADDTLFVACDPVLAYQQYADVLEIEPSNSRALLGRILCLIYTSKVRSSYLNDVHSLLENISYKGSEEMTNYVGFLKKINFALDEYDLALYSKLTHRKYFYDEECIKLYFKRLSEIIKFKKEILLKLGQIKKNYVNQDTEILINMINHNVSERENFLKTIKYTVQGVGYRYSRIVGDKVFIDRDEEVINTKINRQRLYTLDAKEKGKKALIKDKVFKDYTGTIIAKKVSIYLFFLTMILAIGCGIVAYLYFSNQLIFIISLIAASIFLVASIVLLVLHLVWKSILKKRKLRID